jgi:hypothetical protein
MKTTLLIIISALTLSACATRPGADKIVYVDRAVPYCTAPPQVQQFERKVDSLTPSDVNAPGKVVKDYVYDMTVLRSQVKIYKMILDQYNKQTQDFSAVQAEIDKIQPPAK